MNIYSIKIAVTGLLLSLLFLSGCGGGGGTSTPAPTRPEIAAPSGVTATGGINQVTLTWNQADGADSYNIYWSINPSVTPANGTKITGAASPYVHGGLTVSQTYFYVVTAVRNGSESEPSDQTSTVSAHNGENLYAANCSGCHGPLTAPTFHDYTFAGIKAAIAANKGGMGILSRLTDTEIANIVLVLPTHH